jgi:hypothetical protein
MSYRSARSGYTIRVDEIPLGPSRFVIQAAIFYGTQISSTERARLVPRAETELLLAIAGEWERGRRRGARAARIVVDGDRSADRGAGTRTRSTDARAFGTGTRVRLDLNP